MLTEITYGELKLATTATTAELATLVAQLTGTPTTQEAPKVPTQESTTAASPRRRRRSAPAESPAPSAQEAPKVPTQEKAPKAKDGKALYAQIQALFAEGEHERAIGAAESAGWVQVAAKLREKLAAKSPAASTQEAPKVPTQEKPAPKPRQRRSAKPSEATEATPSAAKPPSKPRKPRSTKSNAAAVAAPEGGGVVESKAGSVKVPERLTPPQEEPKAPAGVAEDAESKYADRAYDAALRAAASGDINLVQEALDAAAKGCIQLERTIERTQDAPAKLALRKRLSVYTECRKLLRAEVRKLERDAKVSA